MTGTMTGSRTHELLDFESQAWLDHLRADGPRYDDDVARLRCREEHDSLRPLLASEPAHPEGRNP